MARTGVLPQPGWSAARRAGVAIIPVAGLLAVLNLTGALAQVRPLVPWLGRAAPTYQTTTVRRGDVVVSVTATGPIAAVSTIPLTFKTSGKLAELKVSVGDHVKQGQVLATLDTTDLKTALGQTQANLDQAEANLAKVQAGPTTAQQDVAKASVDNARTAAVNARANVATTQTSVADDLTTAQNGVRTAQLSVASAQDALAAAQDQQARGIASDQTAITNAQKNLTMVQTSVAQNLPLLQQGVQRAKDSLWSAQISRDATCGRSHGTDCAAANANVASAEIGVSTAQSQNDQGVTQGQQLIAQAQTQLDQATSQLANDKAKLAAAVVSAQNQVKQAQANLASTQTSVVQAQHKADAAVQGAQAQADQASGSVAAAEASYEQATAPPAPADVAAAKAQVVNAQAARDTAQANLDAATLVAPADVTVSAINGAVGQFVSGGPVAVGDTALFTLVDLSNLKVTALVNEADVAQVKVGDQVSFTANAFPNRTFNGKVLTIQPQGTTVQNVVNYAVTCSIVPTRDAILYPGMTATATIVADQHAGVLRVPNNALTFSQTALRQGLVQFNRPDASGTNGPSAADAGGQGRPAGSNGPTGTNGPGGARQGGQVGQGQSAGTGANRGLVLTLQDGNLTPVRVGLGPTDGSVTEVSSGLTGGETVVVGMSGAGAQTSGSPNNGPGGGRPGGGAVPVVGGFRGD
jgi:HlyD family secretion protein